MVTMNSTHLTISDDITEGRAHDRVPDSASDDHADSSEEAYDDEDEYYDEAERDDHDSDSEDDLIDAEVVDPGFNKAQGSSKRKASEDPKIQGYGTVKRLAQGGLFPELDANDQSYKVLHRVVCNSSKHHIFKLFEDIPVRGSVGHLSGFEHLRHEEDCVSRYPNLAFLIIKEHHCQPEIAGNDTYETATAGYSRSSQHYSDSGQVRIVGEKLKVTLDRISKAYGSGLMLPPYLWLYHHRSLLRTESRNLSSAESKGIIDLLAYADERYGELYATADRHRRCGQVDKETLPFLFLPNSLVVTYMKSGRAYDLSPTLRAFVLEAWPTFHETTVHLSGWYYKHNSIQSTRAGISSSMNIPFSTTDTRSMAIFPYEDATFAEKSKLISRGREYWNYRILSHVCYDGWDEKEEMLLNEARLIIDYCTYRQLHPHSNYWVEHTRTRQHDTWARTLKHDLGLEAEQYALFPEVLHAFLLKDKKWITVRIEQVQPIVWNTKAFERLVLPEKTKDLVKSLVLVRTTETGRSKGLSLAGKRKDMIAGKGNGLIMLLHGAPGTGKTLTAESVAEIAMKPLYNVTCGDIGTNAEEVERYLKSVLLLGKVWNCILLLDEADVFLEERSLSDLKRNSLVSVFLRTLEYYDGILILTSNRVGTFDEAFSSRIQVSLHFPLLDRSSRRTIWQNFFEMLREDEEEVDFQGLNRRLDELSDIEMNGRQIRNVLTTARQLAMYKKATMEWDHVQRAIRSAADFTRYIQNVHGHTDEQNARDEKLR